MNTSDPTAHFDAYVGGDNVPARAWQFLVDNKLVKSGRLRVDAGGSAGRHLRRAGGAGHLQRLKPPGITW